MSESSLKLALFVITLALLFLLLERYYRLRADYYQEYLRYKEVLLLLKNYQTRQKVPLEENFLRQELSKVGADFVSFQQVDVGYELKARNLRGEQIPALLHSLESSGAEILKLRLVDNTGQGLYELQMTLR
ncbi:MAG: hypothetical protein N3C13_04700 [Aquificaceae bacterium]|nr:hypothetical protein [Aquificaceae bacterium]MCX8060479.1 hypothetical protein [Aquificaceae bacterium]MDW8097765.1 hypothetical protein [Aquificaceae bacterium]